MYVAFKYLYEKARYGHFLSVPRTRKFIDFIIHGFHGFAGLTLSLILFLNEYHTIIQSKSFLIKLKVHLRL